MQFSGAALRWSPAASSIIVSVQMRRDQLSLGTQAKDCTSEKLHLHLNCCFMMDQHQTLSTRWRTFALSVRGMNGWACPWQHYSDHIIFSGSVCSKRQQQTRFLVGLLSARCALEMVANAIPGLFRFNCLQLCHYNVSLINIIRNMSFCSHKWCFLFFLFKRLSNRPQ